MTSHGEYVYVWPDAIARPTTEGILAPFLVCAAFLAVAYFGYVLCQALIEHLLASNWGGITQPGVGLAGILFVAFRFKRMFPNRKALVTRLKASAHGLDVHGVVHHLYTTRDVPFHRIYPWADVQQIELKSVTSVEGAELGFYAVEIALKGAEEFSGHILMEYTGMKDRAQAKLKSANCFTALSAMHPTLGNPSVH
jgi:hypothetical protein